MGIIYKRGRNYYIDVRSDGKRLRKKVGPSKKLAELVLKDAEVQIAKNKFDFRTADGRIADLLKSYLEYSKTNHRPTTTLRLVSAVRNFQVFLALQYPNVKKISQLNLEIFENFKSFRLNTDTGTIKLPADFPYDIPNNCTKASASTLNFEIKTLRSMFNLGIKQGLCRVNPGKEVKFLKVNVSKQPRFLTKSECKLFLQACDQDLYPIFYTFLNTGLRLGELLHLQWQDIDFKRKKLSIRKKDIWIPKTGEREVPLGQGMLKVLQGLRPTNFSKEDYVFPGQDGGVSKRRLRKDLILIAQKAGLKNFSKIHSLRHTFASHLVMKGVDLPTVQKLLGHADIQTTMIYSHLSPDHLVEAVNKLDLS